MYVPLVPCPRCSRHVRHHEASCPFCLAPIGAVRIAPDTSARLTRAAAFAFVSSLAASGCGSEVTTVGDGQGGSSTQAQASGATSSSGNATSTTGQGGGPAGAGGAVPAYGAPAVGSGGGGSAAGGASGVGGGESSGGGNGQPLYGAAPAP